MRRALTALVLLGLVGSIAGQQCNLNGQSFTLPNVGTSSLLVFGQYVNPGNGLNSQRGWQMTLCGATSNAVCSSKASSYIYELAANGNSCDMGLSQMSSPWATTQATINGVTQNAITATFSDASSTRIAVVTVACGGSSSQELTAVNAPDNPAPTTAQPNNGYPGWDVRSNTEKTVWTWQVVFQTATLPNNMCNGAPPPPPPGTNAPGGSPQPPGPTEKPKGDDDEKSSPAAIIFVVIVFVGPVIYVVGTVLYNYLKLGKRGWELAPHPEFWKDFPVLCLDGCRFVKDKFLQLIGKGGGDDQYSKL